jgi:elongator complex protein 2
LIASASNALTAASAAIWVWSRGQNWKPLGTLSGATLTVTALEFTPRNAARDYLLAASRDRHVCLFAPSSRDAPRGEFGDDGWRLLTRFKAHDREIYAASWAPCGALFATAGRDKKVKIWRVVDDACEPACELPKFTAAPTAMAFASDPDAPLAIAIGFDDGGIEVHVASADAASWTLSSRASANDRHGAAVRAVAWRPGSSAVFASAGDDHAVHVYEHE